MLLRYFVLFVFFILSLAASPCPKTFASMGTPLYESVKELQPFLDDDKLHEKIQKYMNDAEELRHAGLLADTKKTKKEKLAYLKKLRSLQKEYDYIVHLIRLKIFKHIRNDDYEAFLSLTSHNLKELFSSRALRERAIEYYKKNRNDKKSRVLEKIIDEEHLLESSSEFFNQTESSQFNSNTALKKDHKDVFISVKKGDNYVDVYFTNTNLYDVTLRVKTKTKNIDVRSSQAELFVLKAKATLKYARFYFKALRAEYAISYHWILGSKDAKHDDNYLYRLPYAVRESHMVSQGFNGKSTHQGSSLYAVDFKMNVGTKIYAARGGIVVKTKDDSDKRGFSKAFAKYGNYVTILHDDGTFGTYYHLKKGGVLVNVGQRVERSYPLGYSGNTGYTSGPHLHFAVFKALGTLKTQSLPVKFISAKGVVTNPKTGSYYQAK
jgi:murein DD-endopeptidase MepM/ murein hydrolase activator NlpD